MRLASFLALLFCSFLSQAQQVPEVQIKKTSEKIVLDGVLDESIWNESIAMTNFHQHFPTDSIMAIGETEMYITYDDEYMYIAAKCYSTSNDFIVRSLRRDYGFGSNDNLTLLFDTYNDQTNALVFGMNPLGARREATVFSGGREGRHFSDSWDNKWDGESKIYDDHWVCELAVPFNSIRYNSESSYWRFQAYRNDLQNNEFTSWILIPQNRILMDLSCMGKIVWETPLPKVGQNISLIPYTSMALNRDFEDLSETGIQTKFNAGGDAKISINSALNLDLTVNPDFSQVEVDRQVTNLDRFEIFFPERRQFFLENADLFSGFGSGRSNPFFSRRIGIAFDTLNEVNVQNTILGGLRLSGKLDEKTRVGLLNLTTDQQINNDLPRFNYTVAAVERQVLGRSNIAAILVNKDALNPESFDGSYANYNRVAGLEYRLATKDSKWSGKTTYHQLFSPSDETDKYSHFTELIRNTRKLRLQWRHLLVGNGFDAEVGFIPRRDIFQFSPEASYRLFPKNEKISQYTFGLNYDRTYKLGKEDHLIVNSFEKIEDQFVLFSSISYANRARVSINYAHSNIRLLDDFDPTRIQEDDVFLPAGAEYSFDEVDIQFRSNPRNKVGYDFSVNGGSFYSGQRIGASTSLSYRMEPLGTVGLNLNYNYIDLKGDFEQAELWLVGPRVDLTFSKTVFFSTFVQYNNQQDNLNINSRFQWRFKPVSDFFIVYTDNYLTDPFDQFASRNRALVAKITYWLNL